MGVHDGGKMLVSLDMEVLSGMASPHELNQPLPERLRTPFQEEPNDLADVTELLRRSTPR